MKLPQVKLIEYTRLIDSDLQPCVEITVRVPLTSLQDAKASGGLDGACRWLGDELCRINYEMEQDFGFI